MTKKTCETLTDFLLTYMQQRSVRYLKQPLLSTLSIFLIGYSSNPEVDFWEVILMEEA